MENERKYTLYMHISPSGKKYVGITQQNVKKRWQNGFGYKNNIHFWRAIEKYGWDSFKHEIIKTNLTKNEAEQLEIYYIAEYDTANPVKGYNKDLGGNLHAEYTEEAKRKMSENHADFSLGNHPQAKSVYKYEKNTGDYICGYSCIAEASIYNNISEESISGVARGVEMTAGGFRWSFEKYDNIGSFKFIPQTAITLYRYDLNGNYIDAVDSMLEARREYGATIHQNMFIDNQVVHAGNYLWTLQKFENVPKYKNPFCKEIIQKDDEGNVINQYVSIAEAVKITGIKTIHSALRGVQKHAGGYVWEYA